jgi:hypothetical protein
MTIREQERRAAQRQRSDPARDREIALSQHRVLSFREWCSLNGISLATGRRILKSGHGPAVIQLSDRRIGISVGANAEWQTARGRSHQSHE